MSIIISAPKSCMFEMTKILVLFHLFPDKTLHGFDNIWCRKLSV